MTNTLNGNALLPDTASLELRSVERSEQGWLVEAAATNSAFCPNCSALSTARHSSYSRDLRDLPIQGRAVKLRLRVGRWRCRNPTCDRGIFCQRLPQVTRKHGRETNRFEEVVESIGYELGGRAGERMSMRLGLAVSDDTLLRRIKRWAQSRPSAGSAPVIGVDDWAWRKGQRYGTILIDLQRSVVADLLPERSSAAFARWLQGLWCKFSRVCALHRFKAMQC